MFRRQMLSPDAKRIACIMDTQVWVQTPMSYTKSEEKSRPDPIIDARISFERDHDPAVGRERLLIRLLSAELTAPSVEVTEWKVKYGSTAVEARDPRQFSGTGQVALRFDGGGSLNIRGFDWTLHLDYASSIARVDESLSSGSLYSSIYVCGAVEEGDLPDPAGVRAEARDRPDSMAAITR